MAGIHWIRILLVFLLMGLLTVKAHAVVAAPRDVALVMDNSGSMRRNDPHHLMSDVVHKLAAGLPAGSRIALIIFADKAELLAPLTGVESSEDVVVAPLAKIDYSGQRTDIAAGFERSLYELRSGCRPGVQKIVILLTDGIMDTGNASRDADRNRWVREDLARTAQAEHIRVFGIAFTETADFELMQSLAQTTGGGYARVLSADGLAAAFDEIRDKLREQDAAAAPASVTPARPFPVRWVAVAIGVALLAVVWIAVRFAILPKKPDVPRFALVEIGGGGGAEGQHIYAQAVIRIGRSPENDLVVSKDTVSVHHAEIRFNEGMFLVRDLKSANGTALNSRRFSSREAFREVPLKHTDRIRFDAYEYEFRLVDTEEAQMKASGHALPETEVRPGSGDVDAPVSEVAVPVPKPKVGEEKRPPEEKQGPVPAAADPRRMAETWIKPAKCKCPNHKGIDATEMCQACKQLFCQYCVEEIAGEFFCQTHAPAFRGQSKV